MTGSTPSQGQVERIAKADIERRVLQAVRRSVDLEPRTQAAIAAAAEMGPDALSEYLSGKRQLRTDSLERLLKVLAIRILPPVGYPIPPASPNSSPIR